MDFHLIASSPQQHLEMMEKLMQLNKSPHVFSRPYQEISESSDFEFSSGSATSNETPPNMFQNPYLSSSNSSMFAGYNVIQDPGNGNIQSNVMMTSNFGNSNEISFSNNSLQKRNSIEAMREMIFRVAMMQPILIDPESVKPPKRKNVKISKDPQSVAARHRRERISEKMRILQRLVPGGTKMDTASMLDEAVHYVKFLKKQVDTLEKGASNRVMVDGLIGFQPAMSSMAMNTYPGLVKNCQNLNIIGSNASMQMLS